MAAVAVGQEKAGFLVRAIALIADAVVLGIVGSILGGILFGGDPSQGSTLSTLLGVAYYVYFWTASGGGQTLGMRLFNIKVVKTDGGSLTIGGALIRYVMLIVSFACLFIGVIWAAFDANKQGWHDKVAGTYVVKK